MLNLLEKELSLLSNEERAKINARFFKTGKGQYGEGDLFIGITLPDLRNVCKKYLDISFEDLSKLISSKYHEYRLAALIILTLKFKNNPEEVYNFYLKNTKFINNWDLVDVSAHLIVGKYLFDKDKKILYKLAKSENLWEKRIAIISTLYFIGNKQFEDTFKISEILLNDKHDLIHKAIGWMLREVGKKDLKQEEEFLNKHYKKMPRTTLRYAIERFEKNKKEFYMN